MAHWKDTCISLDNPGELDRLFTDLAEYSSSFSQLKVLLSGSDIWDIWSQKIISKERKRMASQSSVLVKLVFPSSRSEDSSMSLP